MAVEWFYTTNKQQMGPVTWEELKHLASSGLLKPNDLVWTEGMKEWVKASNQDGLFTEVGITSGSKQATSKSGRTRRRYDDDDDDEDEDEDDRPARNRRKNEGASTGLKVGLIMGGVLLLVLLLFCAGGGLLWRFMRSEAPRPVVQPRPVPAPIPQPAPAPQPNPVPGPGPAVVGRSEQHNRKINPGAMHIQAFPAQPGQHVTVRVTNNPTVPNTHLDLQVQRLGKMVANAGLAQNPSLAFVAQQPGLYQVRIMNRGPGIADCQIHIDVR